MEGEFLQLLVAEAPVEAFERVVNAAQKAGAGDQELERARRRMTSALRVRAVLAERRRREQELAALYATAGDLSSLRDVGLVLEAIVRRARTLLGTDTAYLMLVDRDRGDAYMRVTEGTISADFEHVRLALGAGLGGLVAATASPYYTANYQVDTRFAHTQVVDAAVAAEGLVAILGVPLKLADTVIGVLFAANRRERPFAQAEVSLLSSLAAHAAIALENARLFQEAAQALRDLNAANARVQAHSHDVERAAAAHERLTTLVLGGGGMADVAAAVADLLGGSLLVLDAERRVLAHGGQPADRLDSEILAQGRVGGTGSVCDALAAVAASGATVPVHTGDGLVPRWATPIPAGSERLGALLLAAEQIGDADVRTLERASMVTALVLLGQRSLAEAEQRVRGELLEDLLRPAAGGAERLRSRARLVGLDLDTPHAVVAAAIGEGQRARAVTAAAALAGDHGGMAGEHGGRLVMLLPGLAPTQAAELVSRRLRARLEAPVTVGGAGPAAGPTAIAQAHTEAVECLGALVALGHEGRGASASDLGAFALVLSHGGKEQVDRFVDEVIGAVLAYDAARGTDLAATLEGYFAAGGNVTSAAQGLHIHPNTLYQRLDRVGQLLGTGWQDGDDGLQVHLALRLHRLRARI